jgi:predicted GNAT family acetyltransferase
MELQVADHPDQARYEIRADGELAGVVQYQLRDGVLALLHTQTDGRFRGQGLAGRLVQSTLDAARERQLQVLPYCPYARRWIAEHPGYADLVPFGRRAEFSL